MPACKALVKGRAVATKWSAPAEAKAEAEEEAGADADAEAEAEADDEAEVLGIIDEAEARDEEGASVEAPEAETKSYILKNVF